MGIVQVEQLASASIIGMVRAEGGAIHSIAGLSERLPVEAVRVADVLYVPNAHNPGQGLQVAKGRYLPIEALSYDFTSEFIRARLLEKGINHFDGFIDSDYAGDVCILGNVFSRNFTHWHEELMKLVVLEHAGIHCAYVISGLPAFARTLLELIGVPDARILETSRPTRFRSALYTTPVSYLNVSDYPGVLHRLRSLLLGAAGASNLGERLWLDRGQQTRLGRKLVNEEEVARLLEKYGLQRVDMGALSVREQISAAAGMRVMAGLHGSQFVHSQLMAPKSRVIECFSPLYLNPTYSEIYRVLHHRYSQITSTNTPVFPYPHGGDVLVDCQQLDLALQACDD
ncbi:MAG: glycosyltransferase family 61 protein [Gammaproteobacteria bacterium]|nr:glycosyltransferase family 61 protein [Gammaproteobacteria bacterium]